MGVFDYRNFSGEARALYSDAIALTLYAYTPTGQPLASGWTPVTAGQLGYQGTVGAQGTFFGEQPGFTSAEAEVLARYDGAGKLLGLGIAFRGTGGLGYSDTYGDMQNNLLAAVGPTDYAKNYAKSAFDTLLKDVAAFATSQGLSARDVLISGHSLGGLGVNSVAELSRDHWGGFYEDANYVSFASPTQSSPGTQVLNIGYENDPVFRVLDGTTFTASSLYKHDQPQASATNNLVNFNDHYASTQMTPFSIANPSHWAAHGSLGYADGLNRVIDSAFYDLTHKDSTIFVSTLSESVRGSTWIEDLGRSGEAHTGSTFIIGTDSNDLLRGGKGNDFLEGRDGNDSFRDGGGYNILLGGQGHNLLELQQPLQNFNLAHDGDGTLYLRDSYGGISLTRDIDALVSKESGALWGLFNKDVSYNVTDRGLLSDTGLIAYNHSFEGDAYANSLVASADGDWLFGLSGNDHLQSDKQQVTFVGGEGNDVMSASGANNTYLFSGAFGFDAINGYQGGDTLVFMGVQGAGQGYDYSQHVSQSGSDTLLKVGDYAVTLVGVGLDNLSGAGIVFA
ncbi:polyurethanase [Pseudomonas sp. Irchel s3h17]|uniref:polyurethane esterase n=1 Tax=Pseudomonas sp. Irchel s3h17 TaxID=2009182 RepID=UPI000BA39FC9|nr:polyurethanase [Pseudomonas sp. Irchel s3h17]